MNIITIGLDLAKNVSHVVCCNQVGKLVKKKMLKRNAILSFFAQLPQPCLVGVESCASAHYWAREIEKLGHSVKQIPAQYVKAYLRGNKTDYNDALAIAEAVTRPQMRFVATKSQAQQDIQTLHRLRKKCERDRTANCNEIRGLLYEYGIVIRVGISHVYKRLPELFDKQRDNGLTDMLKDLLAQHYKKLQELKAHLDIYTDKIKQLSQHEVCQRLQSIPGIGPITASALYQHIGTGAGFKNGRAVAASIGLVPRQHSSGGKENLLGISKRGDSYLRTLLVHGARAVVRMSATKDTPLAKWIRQIAQTRGVNKAVVALANKLARISWAVVKQDVMYRADLTSA
jgi:transposase